MGGPRDLRDYATGLIWTTTSLSPLCGAAGRAGIALHVLSDPTKIYSRTPCR